MAEEISYRDVSLYLLGEASESVRERINADLDKPDSQVMAFFNWLGGLEGKCQPLSDDSVPEPLKDRKSSRFPRLYPSDDERSR